MRSIMKSSKPSGPGRNEDTATKRAGGSRRNTGRPLVRTGGCSRESSRGRKGRSKWYACLPPTRFASSGIRKFVQRQILTILSGNPTSRNGLMCRCLRRSKEEDGFNIFGRNNPVFALFANKRSQRSLAGTVTTFFGDQKEDQMGQKIVCCSIQTAINKFIARAYTLRNRVR